MRSILAFVAIGLVLAAVAVSEPEELVRDQFGVRAKNAVDPLEPIPPEEELEFTWFAMDEETIEVGLREMRDEGMEVRDGINLEKPAIVPFGRNQAENSHASAFVFKNMDKNEAHWILYPYSFEYIRPPVEESEWTYNSTASSEESSPPWHLQNHSFFDGAMLSTMDTENFPLHTYMNWIESKTDINLKKAKVVYDMSIAVLQIQAERESDEGVWRKIDITYDSNLFSNALFTAFNPKYPGSTPFYGMAAYEDWLKKNPTMKDSVAFVFVTPDDIKNDALSNFGMLIVPDIMFDELAFVKKTVSGLKDKVSSFVKNGGTLLTTGKGALLTETWGFSPDGTFSSRYTMSSPNSDKQYVDDVSVSGVDDEEDFARRTLSFSLPTEGENRYVSLISGPLLNYPEKSHGFKKVMTFREKSSSQKMMKHDEESGLDSDLDSSQTYPAVMYKAVEKGHVVINMGNPAYTSGAYRFIYNTFYLGASRPIAVDNSLVGGFNRTIPGLEQFDLDVTLDVVNYFTKDMDSAYLYVYTIQGTEVTAKSDKCIVVNDAPAAPEGIIPGDKVFRCGVTPRGLSKSSYTFSIRIIDVLVTQQKKDIPILWPRLEYNDVAHDNRHVTVSYGVKIQAAMSALLRADMNIDPSSWYPLHANGTFIDNVMNCENKEETYALRVEHVSIVPVISPLIDILDQVRLAKALVLDKHYYEEEVNHMGLWLFPYTQEGGDNRTYDYLEWDLLINRSNVLAADWDEGVKLFREPRSDHPNIPPAMGLEPKELVMNAQYQTNVDDDYLLLKQFQFDDSDKFYEHAVQRLMAFLDVSTVGGANTYWNGNIPAKEQSVSNPSVGKLRVLFVRHDLYFYKRYIMPQGLDDSFRAKYFTLDRYDKNDVGPRRSVQGAFGNDVEPDGMIPAECPSAVQFTKCGDKLRTAQRVDTIEDISNGGVKLIHYIVPVEPADGKVAGDLYGFDPDTGKHLVYPEVEFVHTFDLKIDIAPEVSRRGGEMVFKFNSGDLPWNDAKAAVARDDITVSADQIAVYKIYAPSNNELRIRFKRGQMPNENYGRASHLQIFFENTNWAKDKEKSANRTLKMDLYELHYDLSKSTDGFEDWSSKTISDQSVTFQQIGALRMPALRLQFVINGDIEESFMNPYELREPLVRYAMYEQELESHRAVHGSAEFHPKTEPCIVTRNSGFSTFTHVGTSSVPFREYVSTEISLQIPAASETGRVEWNDVWGRHFVQNVRSTIFEYPPIPPPLRNFVMTTTYEILDKQGNRMLGGWRSNEDVDVRVQMKLLNNYPKWFEVTACKENRVLQSCTEPGKSCGKTRIYDTDDNFVAPTGEDDGTLYFKRGQNASYGVCLAGGQVRLEGQQLTEEQMKGILAMTLCAKEFNNDDHSCENAHPGLPVLKRVPNNETENTGSKWNFASRVLSYWPDNYIKENMWDLTHYDYDDNQFDKAYKYHMDNNLPHLEYCHVNSRPDNLIAFPLFKGLGYTMVYDKNYTNPRFASMGVHGWWSDNLQNRDRTLVAGNDKSNDISVGQPSLIKDSDWIDITKLKNAESAVKHAEKNVYTCLFNRRSVKNFVSSNKVSELHNVYENNIVPVPIDFNDKMEFNFDCDHSTWYDPINISQYPNTVYTETPRDWLYFGANLRGGALEDINVIYQMSPLDSDLIKYEGLAKVQDGGRFVYWNPANSKNSYLIVDNPVHVVLAKRNDIEIEQELIPTYTTTFDSVLYHHLTISDPEEIEREWDSPIFTNNYGYGDFTVQLYVGDAGTTALPSPGTTIRVRYTFMNNAGFDINMLKDAITGDNFTQESINAYDLLTNYIHTLRVPDAYNFLEFQVPDELKDHIRIYPCPDVVGIAPLFFDFDSINVVTIRDGWKGDYYVNVEIKNSFPRELRGRLQEIPVKLVTKYFDRLPGKGDPTGIHDYTIEVPSLVFGVPYEESNELWGGKVFYTSGYATEVDPRVKLLKPYVSDEAIIVDEEDIDLYHSCLGMQVDPDENTTLGEFSCLDKLWAEHVQKKVKCEFNITSDTSAASVVSFAPCMKKNAPTFPVKVDAINGPDKAKMHILLRTRADQIESGYQKVSESATCTFKDWMNKDGRAPDLGPATVHAKGAWMKLDWSFSLLSTSGNKLTEQYISPNNNGLAQVSIVLKNTGDYYAYNVAFNVTLATDVRVATEDDVETGAGAAVPKGCAVLNGNGETTFSCDLGIGPFPPGSKKTYPFRVYYSADLRKGAGYGAVTPLNMRVIAEKGAATIDLTATAGEKRVTQTLAGPNGIKYTKGVDTNMVVLTGRHTSEYGLSLSASHKLSNIRVYIWRAKLPDSATWTTFAVTKVPSVHDDVSERFASLNGTGVGDDIAVDYIVLVSRSKLEVTVANSEKISVLAQSNTYEWRVSESNLLLLLLLLPGLAIPALIGAGIFATTKGVNKEPVREIGMAPKQKFVPQELVDEPAPVAATDVSEPPPSLPQRAAPTYVPEEPAPQAATPGKSYAIPTGPTYLRAGVPVNVVDS